MYGLKCVSDVFIREPTDLTILNTNGRPGVSDHDLTKFVTWWNITHTRHPPVDSCPYVGNGNCQVSSTNHCHNFDLNRSGFARLSCKISGKRLICAAGPFPLYIHQFHL